MNKKIPEEAIQKIEKSINSFNKRKMNNFPCKLAFSTRGKFIYLFYTQSEPSSQFHDSKLARLTYNGNLKNLDFAIYKHSTEKYDASEPFFPGDEYLNGTLNGAMKACLQAYPPDNFSDNFDQNPFILLTELINNEFPNGLDSSHLSPEIYRKLLSKLFALKKT